MGHHNDGEAQQQVQIDADDNTYFFNYIFPIYRGIFLFLIYLFLLVFNIKIWQELSLSYQQLFRYKDPQKYTTYKYLLKYALILIGSTFLVFSINEILYRIELFNLAF